MTATVIARARNINSACFVAARERASERKRERGSEVAKERGAGGWRPTLFHFTVDPVASFRSLELDLIKIRAGEALTPPIKSPDYPRAPYYPHLLSLSAKTTISPARDVRHRSAGTAYKGEALRADLTDLPQINRTPVSSGRSR